MNEAEPYQWAVDLVNTRANASSKVKITKKFPSPPGYVETNSQTSTTKGKKKNSAATAVNSTQINELQVQKAWQIALQPAKSAPMNFFMSYMSGTSLQIIPIMTALMLITGPIQALFSIKAAFKPVMGNKATAEQVYAAMIVYVLGQGVLMYIGLRKLNQMGLVPNTKSDWLVWETITDYQQYVKSFVV
ncbi:chaperone EMC4 KNAG_0B00380 [Huiozyma naganishii CBS 8797]|uniref:ER membrane protein complex subunit 4 n=1 Tax=Huiozyma naganishii (strain ATCC MYA-139 / BCRC 22969 / CBS 8797 / KCTC 17520 / NBRC 10181 / NCYC 3082 / Yp74L-3) TaxID=1071383 RepID=J7RUJ6_HUIN7|nr:hypothetical protein KNAG_0B00380 [Kazachstania naganishii CBS 8797]CCK68487.1 hypothetical protein KNAG_0B00380 [Kazachstania naganishii CBS 8797]